jgi:cellulose synthase/poly-beta-1,6-N-acetylglucosamine synthase-like glycosyltransferase
MALPALSHAAAPIVLPALTGVSWTIQTALTIPCLYLLALAAASQFPLPAVRPDTPRRRRSGDESPLFARLAATRRSLRAERPLPADGLPSWVVLVAAHNEAETLPRTLASLAELDYPRSRWRLVVIADNCDDDTARSARRHGARHGLPIEVWTRHDQIERGKGHALQWALQRLIAEGDDDIDGWVVLDADTDVDADLLRAFARGWRAGWQAMQGSYGIRDAASTPRRRLAYLSAGLYHQMRAHGRELFGWSAGLFGNGMAFHWSIAREIGWQARSIVEDIEYQAILALHGIRVHYVPEAKLHAEAPRTLKGSGTQRQRWERGRSALTRYYVPKLMATAWSERQWLPAIMALDIAMPSYTLLGALVALSGLLCLLPGVGTSLWLTALLSFSLYLALGLRYVRGPAWLWPTLLWAPVFAGWVLLLRLKPAAPGTWVRTPRDGITEE